MVDEPATTLCESGRVQRTQGRAAAAVLLVLAAPAASASESVPSWEAEARREIADSEYEITWQDRTVLADLDAAWQAPNRAHGLRTYFTDAGIRVVPRRDETPAWEWSLALAGWGRMDSTASETLEPAEARVEGVRIELDRGGIVEWYVNGRRGLEQGFAVAAPPAPAAGETAPSWVRIDLALGGTLDPAISTDGQAIDFVTASGARVIHYSALEVRDAGGRRLPARMGGFSGPGTLRGIRIVFDDGDAVYPVSVDPLATAAAWMVESDQADARLGFSVATAGDVNGDGYSDVIVGANMYDNGQPDEGGAFVYLGSAAGPSTTFAWSAEGEQMEALFGWSVATAGDVDGDGYSDVLVGAIHYDDGQADEGKVFVYRGSATGPQAGAAWTAQPDQAGAWFGQSVATAGDVNGDGYSDVIVGAYGYANGQNSEGRAFVYTGSAAGLSAAPTWTAESNQLGAQFGISAASAGDVNGDGYSDVIVGSDFYSNGQNHEGRAWVYLGSSGGLAASPAWITESDQAEARHGWSVSTAGDVDGDGYSDVVVGAFQYVNGETSEGRALLYRGSAAGLSTTASWMVEGNQVNATTGFSVSTAGDVNGDGYADVIVGSAHYSNPELSEGQAAVYLGSSSGLATSAAWTVESDDAAASLGWSVATAGDVNGDGYSDVIVGAPFYGNGESSEGSAWVYLGSASGLATTAGWGTSGSPTNGGAQFGAAVAAAGDVNGDGFADVVFGAPLFDGGQTDEGRAFVYLGTAAGPAAAPSWSVEGNQAGAQYGASVATAGDVNGDGYADLVVGAPFYDAGQADEGRAYLYLGSGSGLSTSPAWTAESNQSGANYGASVATAGDVNGDGYADVVVGAPVFSSGQLHEGLAFLYHGSSAGLPAAQSAYLERNQPAAAFGTAVGTAGDVDADGFSDVIVGAPFYDNGQSNEGRAFVYRGSPSGLISPPAWTAESDQADANYGLSVGTAGDVDGDGYADVIVGAPLFDNGLTDQGRAWVYLGSSAGPAPGPAWTAESDQAGAHFGVSVAVAGDVNGDGYADVIVGADQYTPGGRASVFHGSAAGLSPVAAWNTEGVSGARLGSAVGGAGDVNGDGYADVLVGLPLYDAGATDVGRAQLYFGDGGAGLGVRPRQRLSDDSGPIARLGRSNQADSFRLAAFGMSPFGRGGVKLEYEVEGLRSLFDGAASHVGSSWNDSGVGGAYLERVVADPAVTAGAPVHFRVRVHYRRSNAPFQAHGRWLTIPWGGWNEAMLRGAFVPAGRAPDEIAITKVAGGQIRLDWGASCLDGDTDYEVYEGTIGGGFAGYTPRLCSTAGALTATFVPGTGGRYYFVVPRNETSEGSYGTTSAGAERQPGAGTCLHQEFVGCQKYCSGGQFPGAPCAGPEDCPGGCNGLHFGASCLDDVVCSGQCQQDPGIFCGPTQTCGACMNDHSIHCETGQDCMSVGGSCSSFGPCNGVGFCGNPPPGACVGP